MTKKIFALTLFVFLTIATSAQTQQGYVRTLERPNKRVDRIANVIISVNTGSNVRSNSKGAFSFPCSKASYRILRVQKKGYKLVDKGVIGREMPYSPTVKYEIVMISLKQLEKEKQRLENNAYKRGQADRDKQLAKVNKLFEAKLITEEEAIQAKMEIEDKYEKFIENFERLAEHYALTDYKDSDKDRQILQCMENADVDKADSLINSKGDINVRYQEIEKKRKMTELVDGVARTTKEDYINSLNKFADDLYHKYTIVLSRFQNDSAAYFIERRAELDTTNAVWQNDAGLFICEYMKNYSKALLLYNRGLRQSVLQYGVESEQTATLYNNIGTVYHDLKEYDKALKYYNMALTIREKVLDKEHPSVATSYNNIGVVYDNQGNYAKALEYYKMALTIWEKVYGKNHPNVATSYSNISSAYQNRGDYDKALENFNIALTIREKVLGKEHPKVAAIYDNIAKIYLKQKNYNKTLEYSKKAFNVYKKIPQTKYLKVSYLKIGVAYALLNNHTQALEYLLQAEKLYEGTNHQDLLNVYDMIISVYKKMGNYTKVSEYQKKAFYFKLNNK